MKPAFVAQFKVRDRHKYVHKLRNPHATVFERKYDNFKSSSNMFLRPRTQLRHTNIHQTLPIVQKRFKVRFDLFQPAVEKSPKKKPKRPAAFDRTAPTPLSHRPREDEDDWVATPWNGTIPVLFVTAVAWGLSEKWMRTLPVPNDGEFGPMRYANNPDAKYWGNYRRDIQPRKGRRHFDWGI